MRKRLKWAKITSKTGGANEALAARSGVVPESAVVACVVCAHWSCKIDNPQSSLRDYSEGKVYLP